ncbi:TPR-like protein [Pisolithus sp. B1]|nr:TPR-like protein [Pisolithus sp. B1]
MKSTDDVSRKRAELGCCRTGHSESDVALSELAETLHKKFQKECKLDELKEAVAPHHSAEALRPPGNKKQSLSLGKLAIFLSDEYGNRRVVAGLKDAVTLGRATSELHLLGHLDRGPSHHNPRDFRARFRKEADMRDLEGAIELHRAALELRPSGHPRRFSSLQNLALCLSDRYEDQGLNTDLEEATMLNNAARPPCPAGHPDRDTFLHNLLCDLTTRFKKPTDMRGLEEAIELHHAALELRPSGHPRWFSSLRKLSRCLLTRYGNLGVVADLQEVVALGRTALEFYPPGHPDYGTFLHDLACTLRTRFKEQTDIRDLQDAIELHRLALEIRLSGHPDRSSSLQNLALCLSDRYDNAGVVDDLAEAVTLGREALGLRPPGHPNRDISLHDLACNFKTRFEKQVTMEDLEEAIALHRAALELRPSGHPLRFSSLQNLALCLSDRYDNLRVVADSAATTSDRAARTLHSPQHPDRGTADLDEAFALLREALRLLVPGDRHYDISQQCLPARLQMKFEVEQGSPSGGDSIVDLESRFDDTASEQTAFSVASTTDISIDESDIVVGCVVMTPNTGRQL